MKQQVIYSMLAMAAPVAIVQQVQAADVDALSQDGILATSSYTTVYDGQLAQGTYKIKVEGITKEGVIIDVIEGSSNHDYITFTTPGTQTCGNLTLTEAANRTIKVTRKTSDETVKVTIIVDFPDDAIQIAADFTTRFNSYQADVKSANATPFVQSLIGTFETYNNYKDLQLWDPSLTQLNTLVAEAEQTIAKAQADAYLADFKTNLETAKANLADAKTRIAALDDNDASKTDLEAEYATLLGTFKGFINTWINKYTGTTSDIADDAAEAYDTAALDALVYSDTNKDDLIYEWMKAGAMTDLNTFATGTVPTFVNKIKQAAQDNSFFMQVKSWKLATKAELDAAREALDAAITGKLIDVTTDGEGNYTALSQAKDLEAEYAAAEVAFNSYFDDTKASTDVNSIGYHYYTAKDLNTWEDAGKTKLTANVLKLIDDMKTATTGSIDVAKAAYDARITAVKAALDAAVGEDGVTGAYKDAIDAVDSDADLNFTLTKPSDNTVTVDVYEEWRLMLKYKGASGTGTEADPAAGTLNKEYAEDYAIWEEFNEARTNGTVLSWEAAAPYSGDAAAKVNAATVYSDLVENGVSGTNGTVKAKEINDKYTAQNNVVLALDQELDDMWALVSADVRNDNAGLATEYDNIKAHTGAEGALSMQNQLYDLMTNTPGAPANLADATFDAFVQSITGRLDLAITDLAGWYAYDGSAYPLNASQASVADGVLTSNGTTSGVRTELPVMESGKSYIIRFTISNLAAGKTVTTMLLDGAGSGASLSKNAASAPYVNKSGLENGTHEFTFDVDNGDLTGNHLRVQGGAGVAFSLSNISVVEVGVNNSIEDLKLKAATATDEYTALHQIIDNTTGSYNKDLTDALSGVTLAAFTSEVNGEGNYADFTAIPNIDVLAEKWNQTGGYAETQITAKITEMVSDANAAYATDPRTILDYLETIETPSTGLVAVIQDNISTMTTKAGTTKTQYQAIHDEVKARIDQYNTVVAGIETNVLNFTMAYNNLKGDPAFTNLQAAVDDVKARIEAITAALNALTSVDETYDTDIAAIALDNDALTGIEKELENIETKAVDHKTAYDLDMIKQVYTLYVNNIDQEFADAKQSVTDFVTDNLTTTEALNLLGEDVWSGNRFITALQTQANALWDGAAGTINDLETDADPTTGYKGIKDADKTAWVKTDYQAAITQLEVIENKLQDIVDNAHDTDQENPDIASLTTNLNNFKTLIAAEKQAKIDVDALLDALKAQIVAQQQEVNDIPYEADVVTAYDNGAGTPFFDVYDKLGIDHDGNLSGANLYKQVQDAYDALNLTVSNTGVATGDEAGKGQWDVENTGLKATIYDVLAATEGTDAVSGKAVAATIQAYKNAQTQTKAIRQLQNLLTTAGNYITAHRNGYTDGTDTYIAEYNDGSADVVVKPINDVAVSTLADAADVTAAQKTYNDQLDALQQQVDDLNVILSGWTMEEQKDGEGNATSAEEQNKKTSETIENTYRAQLEKVIEDAKKVSTDADNNVKKYDELRNYLMVNVGGPFDNYTKFKDAVDASQDVETKAEWQKVVDDFNTGKLTSSTIQLKKQEGEEIVDNGEYTSPIVDGDCDGIVEWLAAINALYTAGTAEAEYTATYNSIGQLNTAIQEAYLKWNNSYNPQILADNATRWQNVVAAMKLLREEFAKAKKVLDDTKKDAKDTDLEVVVNNAAADLNMIIFDYPTLIDQAEIDFRTNYDNANSVPKLYDSVTDINKISNGVDGLQDNIMNAEDGFTDKVKDHLNHYWNGGATLDAVDYGTGKKAGYDLTSWNAKVTAAPAYVVDEALTPADVADVYADVIAKIAEAEKYATSATEWKVDKLAASVKDLDENFETYVKKDLYDAAKLDVEKRLAKLTATIDADKTAFDAAYKDENRHVAPFDNGVFDNIYAALVAERDNAEQGTNQVVKADGKGLQDEAMWKDGDENPIYGIVNISKTAANNLYTAATEANLADTERAKILAAIDLYDKYYNTDANSLINRANKAAADFKFKKQNAADVNDAIAGLSDKLATATEEILKTYVAEDYRTTLEGYTADEANKANTKSIAYLNGLDPMDPDTKTAIATAEAAIDGTIVSAFTLEKSKLSKEFNALYNDYNDLYNELDNAVTAAQQALDDNTDPAKVTELEQALQAAKDARTAFVENDGAEPYSYYERVKAAMAAIAVDIAAPVDAADLDVLKDLVAEEPIIGALRAELAAKKAGKTVEEYNAPFLTALYAKADGIEVPALEEENFLAYDFKALTEGLDAISTRLQNAQDAIAAHEGDIEMYNSQLDAQLDQIITDLATFTTAETGSIAIAEADKAEYDALVDANTTAKGSLNDFVDGLTTVLNTAKSDINGFGGISTDDYADLITKLEAGIQALKDAIDDRAQNAAEKAAAYVTADGNNGWKTDATINWLTATTAVDEFVTTEYYPTYGNILDVIANLVESAAVDALVAYQDSKFEGIGLEAKRDELLTKCVGSRYKASVLEDIQNELGKLSDTKKEQSIYGAAYELYAAIIDAYAAGTVQAGMADFKLAIDEIETRLKNVETALESQLLGDLNAAITGADSGDGEVDVQDLQILINMVNGLINTDDLDPEVLNAADIDDDGEITINDVTCLANFILTGARYYDWENDVVIKYARQMSADEKLAAELVSQEGNQRTYAITLQNVRNYSAFQMDIVLPEGARLVGKSLTDRANGHRIYFNQMGQVNRVVVHNLFNNEFKGNEGAVLMFTVEGEGAVSYDKILFSQPEGRMFEFSLGSETTGIMDRIANAYDAAKQKVYNMGGRMMDSLKKGVNIIRKDNGETQKVIK